MLCNQAGIDLIKSFEGLRETAYQDQNGNWSIGYGETGPWVVEGLTCNDTQATNWLTQHVQNDAAVTSRLIKTNLSSNEFSAICSFVYNIGSGNFLGSTVLQMINEGKLNMVPQYMALWNEAGGGVSLGLVRRRNAEIDLFNTPDTVNDA